MTEQEYRERSRPIYREHLRLDDKVQDNGLTAEEWAERDRLEEEASRLMLAYAESVFRKE